MKTKLKYKDKKELAKANQKTFHFAEKVVYY